MAALVLVEPSSFWYSMTSILTPPLSAESMILMFSLVPTALRIATASFSSVYFRPATQRNPKW